MSFRPVKPLTPDNYINPHRTVDDPLPTKEELKKVIIVALIILIISIIIMVLVLTKVIPNVYHMDSILVAIFGLAGFFSGMKFISSSVDLMNKEYKN